MTADGDNKRLVRETFDRVWNRGDLDHLDAVHTAGAGLEADRAAAARWLAAFPDLRVSVEEQIGEGEFVATRHLATGTQAREFMGVPVTGRRGTVSGITVDRVRDGRIAESWTCWDVVGMMQQLGVLPAAAPGSSVEEAGAVFAAAAAARPDTGRDGADEGRAAKALVRRFYRDLWERGRLDLVDELFTDDFIGHAPGGELSRGPGSVRAFVADWRSVVPDVTFELHAQHAEGGRCATRFTGRGTHLGTWFGIPPTGREITVSGITMMRVVDGRLVSEWGEFDVMGLLQQLGVIEVPAVQDAHP